ncbi:hypothetical protein BGZ65_000858 [Modicella reniformis]|uniref:Uncharacterized protein n=1 Tax=Modicella reniformis TaxID=1440133 RepID=A0A9P6J2C0_9FUNG|nr:hypothetical protein BGZ65_000858 [Modicella reniformis]
MTTLNFIHTVMAQNPGIETGSEGIKTRHESFQYTAKYKYGFFKTLVKSLYHGEDKIKDGDSCFITAWNRPNPSRPYLVNIWNLAWAGSQEGSAFLNTIDDSGRS